jgi:hypothetical protein
VHGQALPEYGPCKGGAKSRLKSGEACLEGFTWCKTLHNFFVEKVPLILGGYHRKNNFKNDNGFLKKQNKKPTSMGIRLF